MIEDLVSEPLAIIAIVQPYLLLWIAAISFFVTLAIVAVLSPQKKWYELGCMFLVVFVVCFFIGLGSVHLLADIKFIDVELITLEPTIVQIL